MEEFIMRLRRETGDFKIVIDDGAATIPAGLGAEDLIGVIANNGTSIEVLTAATDATTTVTLTATSGTYVYTKATGAVAYTAS